MHSVDSFRKTYFLCKRVLFTKSNYERLSLLKTLKLVIGEKYWLRCFCTAQFRRLCRDTIRLWLVQSTINSQHINRFTVIPNTLSLPFHCRSADYSQLHKLIILVSSWGDNHLSCPPCAIWKAALIKKKINIRKFRMAQVAKSYMTNNGLLTSDMRKYLRISSYIRKPFLIFDFATVPLWISLYMIKIWFSILSLWGRERRWGGVHVCKCSLCSL